jgi:hypothetical protein
MIGSKFPGRCQEPNIWTWGGTVTSKHVLASESLQLLTSRGSVPQSNSLPSADDLTLQEPWITQTNILSFPEGKPTIGGCDFLNSMLLKDSFPEGKPTIGGCDFVNSMSLKD